MICEEELWLWFCNIKGIGNVTMRNLLKFFLSVEQIYQATYKQLMDSGLNETCANQLLESKDERRIHSYMIQLRNKGIRFLYYTHPEYPKRLKYLYDPPYGLYVMGNLPDESKKIVSIVGARNCSNYGREISFYFAKELAKAGIQIVSGMATGIDSFAHQGCLVAGGYTCAILGNSVDYCYPLENYNLYENIRKNGAVVSEYGLGVKPIAGNFPRRNRIISGLSDGILVVEAKEKSGSFITVDQGLEQGKDIFVIPGRITDALSIGCNNLIKMGGEIVLKPDDILKYYRQDVVISQHIDVQLTPEEQQIYQVLTLEQKHINVLLEQTKMEMGKLMEVLLQLELKGLIRQVVKNYYARIIVS